MQNSMWTNSTKRSVERCANVTTCLRISSCARAQGCKCDAHVTHVFGSEGKHVYMRRASTDKFQWILFSCVAEKFVGVHAKKGRCD